MTFRHVVMFTWVETASKSQQADAVVALERLRHEIAELGSLTVGKDAGLAPGNADVAVVVDFADQASYNAYAVDKRHLRVVAEHIRPILKDRFAVQYEL